MTRFRTERGLDRLVNFSDATVAIAITILLLPLVDVAVEIEKESLGELLSSNIGTIIAFAATFAVIARLWTAHHRIFEAATDYDNGAIWINFLWLASIVRDAVHGERARTLRPRRSQRERPVRGHDDALEHRAALAR